MFIFVTSIEIQYMNLSPSIFGPTQSELQSYSWKIRGENILTLGIIAKRKSTLDITAAEVGFHLERRST